MHYTSSVARPKLLSLMAFFSLHYFYFYTLSSFETSTFTLLLE